MSFTCEYFTLSDEELRLFEVTYPGVPIEVELQKMKVWLWANPNRAKKQMRRFICNWLSKTHGRLLEAETAATAREMIRREQQRHDATVGKWNGYR